MRVGSAEKVFKVGRRDSWNWPTCRAWFAARYSCMKVIPPMAHWALCHRRCQTQLVIAVSSSFVNFSPKCWNVNLDHSARCVKSFKLITLVSMDEKRVQNYVGKCNKEGRKRTQERSICSNNRVSVFVTHNFSFSGRIITDLWLHFCSLPQD